MSKPNNEILTCPICSRKSHKFNFEKHHLVPKSKGGKDTELVCVDCGDMIHQCITNKELKNSYNSLEKIKSHEKIIKWIEWISKKPSFGITMAKKKRR